MICERKGRNQYGEERSNAKLTEEIVRFARSHYVPGDAEYGLRALARRFGVHDETMRDALQGRRWRHVDDAG